MSEKLTCPRPTKNGVCGAEIIDGRCSECEFQPPEVKPQAGTASSSAGGTASRGVGWGTTASQNPSVSPSRGFGSGICNR